MDGLGSIVISMAAIFVVALVLVVAVAIRSQRRREGTARTRVRRRLAQHRAHTSGQPALFAQAPKDLNGSTPYSSTTGRSPGQVG